MFRASPLIAQIALVILLVGSILLLSTGRSSITTSQMSTATSTQPAAASTAISAAATTTQATTTVEVKKAAAVPKKPQPSQNTDASSPEAVRIENPYSTPPLDFADINTATRAALVNIFCTPHGGSLHPISGSGIIIDPRGVILTNAHVGQYVLLSESRDINLDCLIRTGSPASAHYKAAVLYIPSVWVSAHAQDVNAEHPTGTGEHDYALLYIVGSTDGSALPASFPAITPDTREAVAFVGDSVLVASYPAEFAASTINSNLYPVSSISDINQLFTFQSGSVDVISVGSVIEAQSGSSGGAIVNAWERLVGLITTTSEGATTADRQLRGITTSYIDRDLIAQSGASLSAMLSGDLYQKTSDFTDTQAPSLVDQYLPFLKK